MKVKCAEVVKLDAAEVNPFKLSDAALPLWYKWGADKAGFRSVETFSQFCELAGVQNPSNLPGGMVWDASDFLGRCAFRDYSFLSLTGDVYFIAKETLENLSTVIMSIALVTLESIPR